MTAILTGDVVGSRLEQVDSWLTPLKRGLQKAGNSPGQWEIYRGDSFQLECKPEESLEIAFYLKAIMRQTGEHDVRIGIGLGEKSYSSDTITSSNGSAFVRSGECFDQLGKQTMAIATGHEDKDRQLNLLLQIYLLTADKWNRAEAKAVEVALDNPSMNQVQLSKLLDRSQSTVSASLKRAGFEELRRLIVYSNEYMFAT